MPTIVQEIALPVRGDGSALKLVQGQSTFGLVHVEAVPPVEGVTPVVRYTPDVDNETANTTFWVTGCLPAGQFPAPGMTVTLKLTYSGE